MSAAALRKPDMEGSDAIAAPADAVAGYCSANSLRMPSTFSARFAIICSSVTTGTPIFLNTAAWFHGSPTE